MKIKHAQSPGEIEDVRRLFRDYEAFLDVDLCFQRIPPYYANPLPGVVYWELKLNKIEPANQMAPWNP